MTRILHNPLLWIAAIIATVFLLNSTSVWKTFYPFPYKEHVMQYAGESGLDPYLIAAVARTESKFNNDAVSPRGAIGIMQIMPETAQWIAESSGLQYDETKLVEPEYNLRLGTLYLANLSQEFDGNFILVLASYNGGRGRVKQWLEDKRWSGELDTLEDIPYGETREFVKKVLRAYRIYREIYAEEL